MSVCTCPCHLRVLFIKCFQEVPCLLVPCSWLLRATSSDWIRDSIIHQYKYSSFIAAPGKIAIIMTILSKWNPTVIIRYNIFGLILFFFLKADNTAWLFCSADSMICPRERGFALKEENLSKHCSCVYTWMYTLIQCQCALYYISDIFEHGFVIWLWAVRMSGVQWVCYEGHACISIQIKSSPQTWCLISHLPQNAWV